MTPGHNSPPCGLTVFLTVKSLSTHGQVEGDASSRHGSLVPPATRYSTLQDLDAGRHTEIDMFSGALMRMGQELGIPTPYNEYTYHMIKALEEKNDGLFDYAAKASDLTCAK